MGWIDILAGPQWAEGIEAGMLKKKGEKPKAPPPPPDKGMKKTSAPAKKKKAPAPPVSDSERFFAGEDMTPPPEEPAVTAKPVTGGDVDLGDLGTGNQKSFSMDELAELLDLLGRDKVELPNFDLGMKSAYGDITPEQLARTPLDVRPLSAFVDDIYGTKLHARTLDLPSEYFKKLRAVQELREGSRALQQVKGQAALEKYKADLEQLTGGSPLQRSQALLNLVKAKQGGGGSGLASLLGILNYKRGIEKDRRDEQNRAEDKNREMDEKAIKRRNDLQAAMRTSIEKSGYSLVADKINTSRMALMNMNSGTDDYIAINAFIKNLDKDSAVMWNEAVGFTKSAGLINSWLNKASEYRTGSNIPPAQRWAMLRALTKMEDLNDKRLKRIVSGYNEQARQNKLNPRDVTEPLIKESILPDQQMDFEMIGKDGKKKKVRTSGRKFLDFWNETQGSTLIPAGAR